MTPQSPESPLSGTDHVRLAESVEGLRQAVETEGRAHQRSVHAFAGALGVVAVLLIVSLIVAVDNHRQNERVEFLLEERARAVVAQCKNTNEVRTTIRSLFVGLGELIASFPGETPRTPEEQAAWDRRVTPLREGVAKLVGPLAPMDCSRKALGLPEDGY